MIKNILALVQEKWEFEHTYNTKRSTYKPYLEWIVEEIQEATTEIKPNNTVYLEDELSDILRDYLNILETLTREKYIHSPEAVFSRCHNKYKERYADKVANITWETTKKRHKKILEEEHNTLYST